MPPTVRRGAQLVPVPAVAAPDQRRLAALFAQRAAWLGLDPQAPLPPGTGTTVVVLLSRFDPGELVQGARRFVAGLSAAEAGAWQRSWTRARFLFGNPANLPGHTPPRCVGDSGALAWLGPYPAGRLPGVSRLLKPVTGRLPDLPVELGVPALPGIPPSGSTRRLYLAVAGLSLVDYLVHIHHTIAEAVLLGRLRADEAVRLIHRPELAEPGYAEPGSGEPGYARVHFAAPGQAKLRLYSWLTPAGRPARTNAELPGGEPDAG